MFKNIIPVTIFKHFLTLLRHLFLTQAEKDEQIYDVFLFVVSSLLNLLAIA